MLKKVSKGRGFWAWARAAFLGRREDESRLGFFYLRQAFRNAARDADREKYFELFFNIPAKQAHGRRIRYPRHYF